MTAGKERIETVFASGRKPALITFTVAGDPDYATSLSLIREMAGAGADIIELGLPFSDPVADGPVIQRADLRAMDAGMNTDRLFELVREFRSTNQTPVVLLTYANLIIRRGIERFCLDAVSAGIDGLVIADLPYEESAPFRAAAQEAGMALIMMISQTTSPERLDQIIRVASGFIYLVAVKGITGVRTGVDKEAVSLLQAVQQKTRVPVAPGFGISNPGQVREWAAAGADAVIVGSAIVRTLEENLEDRRAMIRAVTTQVRQLRADH
jgi:tryptophan synthase alpha chain